MKYIYLPPAKKREILALKWPTPEGRRKVTLMTLQRALRFLSHSKLSDMLRAAALSRGGVLYDGSVNSGLRPGIDVRKDGVEYRFKVNGSGVHTFVTYNYQTRIATLQTPGDPLIYENISPVRLLVIFRMAVRLNSAKQADRENLGLRELY